MKRVIISLIGKGSYKKTEVIYRGRSIGVGSFSPKVLADHLQCKLIILGLNTDETINAIKSHQLKEEDSFLIKPDEEEKIKTMVLELIYQYSKEGYDEVILDFTHGFRHISFIALLATLYFKLYYNLTQQKNTKISLIYWEYWDEEKKVEAKYLDESYFNILESSDEISKIIESLDDVKLDNKIKEMEKELYTFENKIKKSEGKEREKLIELKKNLKDKSSLLKKVRNILFNINIGNVHPNFLIYVKNWLNEEIRSDLEIENKIIMETIKARIEMLLNEINCDYIYLSQANLGELFWKRGRYQLGAALMRESLTSLLVQKYSGECLVYSAKEREKYDKNSLFYLEKEIKKKGGKKIGKIKGELMKIRNALEHPLADLNKYSDLSYISKSNNNVLTPKYEKINNFPKEMIEALKEMED